MWTKWVDRRPTDTEKFYRWRVSPRPILGMELQPEWSDKMWGCWDGNKPKEFFPPHSRWNGWSRDVDPSIEWRECTEDEAREKAPIKWNGLNLLPCPFTGKVPEVKYHMTYIGSPPYQPLGLEIKSSMLGFNQWRDAKAMQESWNKRS